MSVPGSMVIDVFPWLHFLGPLVGNCIQSEIESVLPASLVGFEH